jgi:hypothetical protein
MAQLPTMLYRLAGGQPREQQDEVPG